MPAADGGSSFTPKPPRKKKKSAVSPQIRSRKGSSTTYRPSSNLVENNFNWPFTHSTNPSPVTKSISTNIASAPRQVSSSGMDTTPMFNSVASISPARTVDLDWLLKPFTHSMDRGSNAYHGYDALPKPKAPFEGMGIILAKLLKEEGVI